MSDKPKQFTQTSLPQYVPVNNNLVSVGGNTIVSTGSIQSRNFSNMGVSSGFQLKNNGDAILNNLTARGSITLSSYTVANLPTTLAYYGFNSPSSNAAGAGGGLTNPTDVYTDNNTFATTTGSGGTVKDSYTEASNVNYSFGSTQHYTQAFTAGSTYTLNAIALDMAKFSDTATGTLTVSLYAADVDSKPTGSVLCSGTYDISLLSLTPAYVLVLMSSTYEVTSATEYVIKIEISAASAIQLYMKTPNTAGDCWFYDGVSYSAWTAGVLFKTYESAPSYILKVALSKNNGTAYSSYISQSFVESPTYATYGYGGTELWGTTWTGANLSDGSLRLKLYWDAGVTIFTSLAGFGFNIEPSTVITGIEVVVKAKYVASVLSIDHVKVRAYAGNAAVSVTVGSLAYATNGRKIGEGAAAGTGVLCYFDSTNTWRTVDTGQQVEQ